MGKHILTVDGTIHSWGPGLGELSTSFRLLFLACEKETPFLPTTGALEAGW